jgi:ribosomal-protein-alanine N-acetyltransferase
VDTDAPRWFQMRTDPRSMRYIDKELPKSVEEVLELVELKESREMIGMIGFHRNDFANHRAEVGYQFFPDFWRKGYASESLKAILDYAFDQMKLHSIMANINPANDASRALLEKFGFKQEAYFRENYHFNGKFLDSAIYCLIVSDHKKLNP